MEIKVINWQTSGKLKGHTAEWVGKMIVGTAFPPYAEIRKETQAGSRLSLFVGREDLPKRIVGVGGDKGRRVRLALKSTGHPPIMFDETEMAELIEVILEAQKKLDTHHLYLTDKERDKFIELRQHLSIKGICRALGIAQRKLDATRRMYPEWSAKIAPKKTNRPTRNEFEADVELMKQSTEKREFVASLAEKYDVTVATIKRWITRLEVDGEWDENREYTRWTAH